MKHYTFVDYATQGYAAVAGLLLLVFHNDTVPHWPGLLALHLAGMALVHGLIQGHARSWPDKVAPASRLRPGARARLKAPVTQRSAAVPAAGSGGVSPPGPTPGRTPGELAGGTPALRDLLDFLRHFYPVPLYLWFFCETGWLNRMFFRDYLDPVVMSWDQALFGCQPSLLFMQKLPYLAVSELFYAAYFSYYVMIVGIGLALFCRDRQSFFHYVSVVSFVFYVCYLIYLVLPVIGPRVFFQAVGGYVLPADSQRLAPTDVYPAAVQAGPFFRLMNWIYQVFEAPGSAIPSSHVAVALCTVFFSFRYLRPFRYFHLGVAVMLCLATIYCRYHYVVDVLAGVVAAAVLVPLGDWLYARFTPGSTSGRLKLRSG